MRFYDTGIFNPLLLDDSGSTIESINRFLDKAVFPFYVRYLFLVVF